MPETLFPPSSPTDVVQTGANRGSLPGFAKPDHVHQGLGLFSILVPTDSAPSNVAATGTSNAAARRDHLHGREKWNLAAAVAPTVNEDSGDGYIVGSVWLDTTADDAYIALDVTVGAAVWKKITP